MPTLRTGLVFAIVALLAVPLLPAASADESLPFIVFGRLAQIADNDLPEGAVCNFSICHLPSQMPVCVLPICGANGITENVTQLVDDTLQCLSPGNPCTVAFACFEVVRGVDILYPYDPAGTKIIVSVVGKGAIPIINSPGQGLWTLHLTFALSGLCY